MFLAWNEIKYSKVRYVLIMGVLFLIAYLVFFLTGLAYGLAQDNRTAIDSWEADGIILPEEANGNINMALLSDQAVDQVAATEKAVLGQMAAVVEREDSSADERLDVRFLGIKVDEFLMPEIIEGRAFETDQEVVVDVSLRDEGLLSLNDSVSLLSSEQTFEVVGFIDNAKLSVSPVMYTTIEAFQEIRFGEMEQERDELAISAIVVRATNGDIANVTIDNEQLELIAISDFISDLPGYNAQVLTFAFMISFLIVIAAIVIGIFIYVLTLQKVSTFGVMKAQGISSGYLARSVIVQTFVLSAIGIGLGFLGTAGTQLALPAAVPFQSNGLFLIVVSAVMLIIAVLGALFSVRTIVKIDPLKAIS
ncbi:putative ABC transport system permease protein [Amphibacillus marinus]|uniref:Putative hemin transport system permease protein HrtB n=1 Tax=Amphibacillus marinus TaxID=872970 RepID=A0A1H8LF50_9BACI|nr:ABC transporter permease [Amphibacillus marinus]SEO03398.1 putative ABC transport system permease protein [Amphibacillus marinus]